MHPPPTEDRDGFTDRTIAAALRILARVNVRVFAFVLKPPDDRCEAARVVVASRSATEAAHTLRAAGWHRVSWQAAKLSRDGDERAVALAEPGVAWWYPWTQEPPREWTRA